MEALPHELISVIGGHLLPKWRCRLYICCRNWWQKLRIGDIYLDSYARFLKVINEIKCNVQYTCLKVINTRTPMLRELSKYEPTRSCLFIYNKKRTVYHYNINRHTVCALNSKGKGMFINTKCEIIDMGFHSYINDLNDFANILCYINTMTVPGIIHKNIRYIFNYISINDLYNLVTALGPIYYFYYCAAYKFTPHNTSRSYIHEKLRYILSKPIYEQIYMIE
jgi:hypothetical protein